MQRIIWHWTGGGHRPNDYDRSAYHYIIDGDGDVHEGVHQPEANRRIVNGNDGSTYAAHVGGLNTGSIGVSVAAMVGAQDRPFNAGNAPIREAQITAMVALTARLCGRYGIPVGRRTTLSHAEVGPTLGVPQPGKWDITWLPGTDGVSPAVEVGDTLRSRLQTAMAGGGGGREPLDIAEGSVWVAVNTVMNSMNGIVAGASYQVLYANDESVTLSPLRWTCEPDVRIPTPWFRLGFEQSRMCLAPATFRLTGRLPRVYR